MAVRKDKEKALPNTTDYIFEVRSQEIAKKPKQKFYWQIIQRRTELINSAVKKP